MFTYEQLLAHSGSRRKFHTKRFVTKMSIGVFQYKRYRRTVRNKKESDGEKFVFTKKENNNKNGAFAATF